MRRRMWTALLMAGSLLAAMPTFAWGDTRGSTAGESRQAVEAQVVIDGKVVGSFTDFTLSSTVEEVDTLCPVSGAKCDDTAWQTAALRAVWQVGAAADELERTTWLSTKAKHDTAMNAIGNVRRNARKLEDCLTDSACTLKTRHDTVKNSVGNIRFVIAVVTETAGQDGGVDQAALRRLTAAVGALEPLTADWTIRRATGRPIDTPMGLRGAQGSAGALLEWHKQVLDGKVERKSGSVILLDRSGAEVVRYNFSKAWPIKYSATLTSEQIDLAVEKVERVPSR